MKITFVMIATLLATFVSADQVLIPIKALDVPGAHGSIWRSTLAVTNHGGNDVYVAGIDVCQVNPCPATLVSSGSTVFSSVYGSFIGVDAADLNSIKFELRVQDISRQAETWGTSIPTVPENKALSAPNRASLTDIPVTSEFRSLLRVYDFDPVGFSTPRKVRVRFYSVDRLSTPAHPVADVLLHESLYELPADPTNPFSASPLVSIPLWTIDQLTTSSRVRVEVEASSPGLRFWAFVSVTNNQTQHVTVINP